MLTQLASYGELCLDAAGFVSLQAWRNACGRTDISCLSGYVGNRYGLTKQHLEIAFDHGKKFSPNREGDSHEAASWASGPVREIDQARSIMDAWGLDWRSVPCIDSAVDWGPSQAEWSRCMDWWRLYVDHALAVGFWGGYYGHTGFGNDLIRQPWWPQQFPTWTWGGSGVITGTAMKQYVGYPSGNNYSSIGCTVDESQVRSGLWMATSFDTAPVEDDVTPEQAEQLANIERFVGLIFNAVSGDPGTGISMEWAVQSAWDVLRLDKHQLVDATVAAIGTGGITDTQVRAILEKIAEVKGWVVDTHDDLAADVAALTDKVDKIPTRGTWGP